MGAIAGMARSYREPGATITGIDHYYRPKRIHIVFHRYIVRPNAIHRYAHD